MSFFKGYNPSYYFRRKVEERNKSKAHERSDACIYRKTCSNYLDYCRKCPRYLKA